MRSLGALAWDGAHQPKTDGYTSLKADADAMQDVLVDLRRRLHREPGVALNLQRTQQRVQVRQSRSRSASRCLR
ncbi:hypothetical protein [Rhodococcus sp. LB1]|uniref:hypothetical protein n=1 Tax=Rhodococcus sp. LB1 TaxID=1807499 RepID=UPI00077A9216|nr:hypothetical protein [Rhodococcus sp. LB1]KXX60908.1 hypothetical protein AZG88_35700 [Rhodococcus sp. LB1]